MCKKIRCFLFFCMATVGMTMFGSVSASEICGQSVLIDFIAGQHINVGKISISNDETTLFVKIDLVDSWYMTESHVAVGGSLADIPQTKTGNPIPGKFPYSQSYNPPVSSAIYEIPLDAINGFNQCGQQLYIAVHAAVEQIVDGQIIQGQTAWGAGNPFPGKNWATYILYTVQCCDHPPQCSQNRTQTQGGWGTSCSGNNPGCYRDVHFDSCMPSGLVVGIGNSLSFASSSDIEAFLPSGGAPAALTASYLNPTSALGSLAGNTTALKLSVSFDACDANFGPSNIPLESMVIVDPSSLCYGKTVGQVLQDAEIILGGGSGSGLSPSQINSCVDLINNAFVDGTANTNKVCDPQSSH
jgi:hypothetical protein